MPKSKQSSTHQAGRLSSSRRPSLNNTLFRTINKRRNDSIQSPQLYEHSPVQRPPTSMSRTDLSSSKARPLTQSQVIENTSLTSPVNPRAPTPAIKEYVKRMTQKKEEPLTQRNISNVSREEPATRLSVKSINHTLIQPPRSIEELEKKI